MYVAIKAPYTKGSLLVWLDQFQSLSVCQDNDSTKLSVCLIPQSLIKLCNYLSLYQVAIMSLIYVIMSPWTYLCVICLPVYVFLSAILQAHLLSYLSFQSYYPHYYASIKTHLCISVCSFWVVFSTYHPPSNAEVKNAHHMPSWHNA